MIHSCYQKTFHKGLDIIGRQLWQGKILRCCLHHPSLSTWCHLYESKNDQGMITLTGLDCGAFDTLCGLFAPEFDSFTLFVPSGESCFYHRKQGKRGGHDTFVQRMALD